MPKIPTDIPDFEPGVYLAEIENCTQKFSKAGNDMFVVRWRAVDFDIKASLCMDFIVFSDGAAGLLRAKLGVLGFDPGQVVQPADLIGRRACLLIIHDEHEGRVSCKVDTNFDDGCKAGYWPEDALPDNVQAWVMKPTSEQATNIDDDTPF